MKKLLGLLLLLALSTVVLSSCQTLQLDAAPKPTITIPTPTVETSANTEKKSEDDDENSPDCVRAKPEPVIDAEIFQKTNFTLKKNKEFPFEYRGYETVEFEGGDKLLIENVGCENFTLIFHFETDKFSGKTADAKFWYENAAKLIEKTMKGLREPNYIDDQVKALNSYIEKNKKLEFDREIEVQGEGIRENVSLKKVKKLKNKKVEIVLSFNTGPL